MEIQVENKSIDEILKGILESLTKVNFRKLAGEKYVEDPEKNKLQVKHYVVPTIDHVLEQANTNGYSLCQHHENIFLYNGTHWTLLADEKLKAFLGECSKKLGMDETTTKFFQFRETLYKQFQSAAYLGRPEPLRGTVLINLQNGTYEVNEKENKLRDFRNQDFLTYQLPFSFDDSATAPKFQKYLNEVLPDKDLQDILAEYIGYVFVRHLKLEKVLLLYGSGANGKSVFFEIVNALLGEQNISNFSLTSLNNEAFRAKLANKLLNYGSEIKGSLESDIFKQLASGEPVEAKALYKDPFTMKDYAKLMFNCNELPKDVEHNEAYFRRFLIVPFLVTIPEHERNPELPQEIISRELSGIFNWVLEGLNRVLKSKGFTRSETSRQFLDKYKKESDSVAMFLEEDSFKPSISQTKPLSEFYSLYTTYCKVNGVHPLGNKNFKNRLETHKIKCERKNYGNVCYVESSLF